MYTYIHIYIYICNIIYVYTYVTYLYVCIHTYIQRERETLYRHHIDIIYIYIYIHTYRRKYIYICVDMYIYIYIYVCMYRWVRGKQTNMGTSLSGFCIWEHGNIETSKIWFGSPFAVAPPSLGPRLIVCMYTHVCRGAASTMRTHVATNDIRVATCRHMLGLAIAPYICSILLVCFVYA